MSELRSFQIRGKHWILALLVTSCAAVSSACAKDTAPTWLVGYWIQTADEDGEPYDDTLEFRRDGTFVSYSKTCNQIVASFHLTNGNVYVTAPTKKGKVSLLYVPSQDHKRLVLTSVRTANNAVYEPQAKSAGCVPVGT
jgi:hypothetical protein